MSQPSTSLPAEIAELMSVTVAQWSQSLVTDGAGQWTYADPIQIDCWLEGEGYGIHAGVTNSRPNFNQNILQQTRRTEIDLYFDGDNANAQSFKMTDTFTLTLPGYQGLSMMPSVIETFFGPPFDNFSPWCILVGF